MDIIDRAIEQKLHRCDEEFAYEQSWENFEKQAALKKVFLFGAGGGADFFFEKYRDLIKLEGVIDNDIRKKGIEIGEILSEAWGSRAGGLRVCSVDLLKHYRPKEIVVLITSTKYYRAIAAQLKKMGIDVCFVLLLMEANERAGKERVAITAEEKEAAYAQKCVVQFPVEHRKIFFRAIGDYADHGKYITESLLKMADDLDVVWMVNDLQAEVPEGVRLVFSGNRKKCIYEIETAHVWVLDLPVFSCIVKRKEQVYIQTKHWASITLKKFYLDAKVFETDWNKLKVWRRESEIIDYIITGSEFDRESCRRGFRHKGEFLEIGSPRSDALFDGKKYRKKICDKYGLKEDWHIALYAPTYRFLYRDNQQQHVSREIELDYEAVKEAFEKKFGGRWYIMLRLHPSVAATGRFIKKPDYVIDTSVYPDSEELVAAADVLISDYSSIMFEAAFAEKPVFLFATDVEEYTAHEYELLINYNELPFSRAGSNGELVGKIEDFEEDFYKRQLNEFMDKYGVHEDGHASERAAEFILGLIAETGED